MKNTLVLALALLLIISGCGRKKPQPSVRLHQPIGGFSFITPDTWSQKKLAGLDFIIVSTEADFGTRPNIFVDFVRSPGQVGNVAKQTIETNRRNHPSYTVLQESPFITASGLNGIRISAHRINKSKIPLALFHYLIQDADRTIAITCTCAEPVKQKYAPLFDAAMTSLESD